jgi:hypothetical protein
MGWVRGDGCLDQNLIRPESYEQGQPGKGTHSEGEWLLFPSDQQQEQAGQDHQESFLVTLAVLSLLLPWCNHTWHLWLNRQNLGRLSSCPGQL